MDERKHTAGNQALLGNEDCPQVTLVGSALCFLF